MALTRDGGRSERQGKTHLERNELVVDQIDEMRPLELPLSLDSQPSHRVSTRARKVSA